MASRLGQPEQPRQRGGVLRPYELQGPPPAATFDGTPMEEVLRELRGEILRLWEEAGGAETLR